jgi:hypothetical protein
MVTFYSFPRDHWTHLRTTNPVESPFSAVRLRTDDGLLHPLQLEDRDLPSRNRVREDPGAKLFNFTVHRLSLVTG